MRGLSSKIQEESAGVVVKDTERRGGVCFQEYGRRARSVLSRIWEEGTGIVVKDT